MLNLMLTFLNFEIEIKAFKLKLKFNIKVLYAV